MLIPALFILQAINLSPEDVAEIPRSPTVVRGVYLSPGVIYSGKNIDTFFRMAKLGILNSCVIDIKDVKGRVMFSMYEDFIDRCKKNGVYIIGRQCVFKDREYAFKDSGKYALKDLEGSIWYQEKSGYWVDPSLDEVKNHNLKITERAFNNGFDEVQYDYIRYPSGSKPYRNNANKLNNILKFLERARNIKPDDKRISVTLYGYAVWGDVLLREGQNIEKMAEKVDAVYPMLYPSHFHNDFLADSTEEWRTYEIIYRSVEKARERLDGSRISIIPYLQAFNWKRSRMGKEYVKNQLRAARHSDSDGFILWEAGGDYELGFNELLDFYFEVCCDYYIKPLPFH